MSYSEALVTAHSTESNESSLVKDILHLLNVWERIESLTNGSASQLEQIAIARAGVEKLRDVWHISADEIDELDEYAAEFRQMFEVPPNQIHTEAC